MADKTLANTLRTVLATLKESLASSSRPFVTPFEQPAFLATREREAIAVSVANGASLASMSPRLQVAAGHARQIDLVIVSSRAIEFVLRIYSAGRRAYVDTPAVTLVANTTTTAQYTSPPGVEVEVLFTNATGSAATVSAWLRAI